MAASGALAEQRRTGQGGLEGAGKEEAVKAKQKKKRSCTECIHEWACQAWTLGGRLAEANADKCQIYERVQDSAAYHIGYRDGIKMKEGK